MLMNVCSPRLLASSLKHENKILTHLGKAALRMHNPQVGLASRTKTQHFFTVLVCLCTQNAFLGHICSNQHWLKWGPWVFYDINNEDIALRITRDWCLFSAFYMRILSFKLSVWNLWSLVICDCHATYQKWTGKIKL